MSSSNNSADSSANIQAPQKPVVRGLWPHYWQHLGVGIIIWVAATFGGFAYLYLTAKAAEFPSASESDSVYFMASPLVLVPTLVGAVVGGLLRQPLLAWISRRARSRWALVGSAVAGFEATVAAAALLYWLGSGAGFTGEAASRLLVSLGVCFGLSLPWLLSTAWASWRLAYELNPALRPVASPLAES